MIPDRLSAAIDLAYRQRFRDGRQYSLAAVGERYDGAVVAAVNGWGACGVEPSFHAEARVLRKIGAGGTVYVARVRKDGSVGMSRPCTSCCRMLRFRGAKCYYTIDEGEWACLES